MIPNAIPNTGESEREAVIAAIETGMLAVGPAIGELERKVSQKLNNAPAVAVQSGTAALHLALLTSNVQSDDIVIVPETTFVATANAISYCNAYPVFADVDPVSGLIDVPAVERYLQESCHSRAGVTVDKNSGRRIRSIVPVHLYGYPADIDALVRVSEEYGLALIEDAAEALGGTYKDKPVGSPHHTTILSFNGNKVVTGGAGGMVVSSDPARIAQCRHLASQARTDAVQFTHDQIGFNYRMPNLNAAVALAQFGRLEEFISKKRYIREFYASALRPLMGVDMVDDDPNTESSCWMSIMRLNPQQYPEGALPVLTALIERGIGARPTWVPLGSMDLFAGAMRLGGRGANDYYTSTLCLPCSTGITDPELEKVARTIKQVLEEA